MLTVAVLTSAAGCTRSAIGAVSAAAETTDGGGAPTAASRELESVGSRGIYAMGASIAGVERDRERQPALSMFARPSPISKRGTCARGAPIA